MYLNLYQKYILELLTEYGGLFETAARSYGKAF